MSENPQTCQVPEMKEIPSATELVAEGHLTREEREYMNDMIAQDKEQVFETTRQSCQDFIETDYGGFSEKLLGGRESIVEAKKLLGITPIDGVYSRELFRAIIDFQKENSLKVDGILGKQTLNQIREKVTLVDREASTESTDSLFTLIEGAENTNEVVETVVNEVLRCYIDRLNSREGIELSVSAIYDDVVAILTGLGDKLPEGNIFKEDIPLLVVNFLEPREKGERLISELMKQSIGLLLGNTQKANVDTEAFKKGAESAILFLYDVAASKSPEQLQASMKEFSSIPEVAEIFQTIPELKKIITDVLPGIIRSIDRTTLQTSMSRLFTSLESSIAIIRDLHPEEPVPVDLKLGIITSVTEFTTSILNEQTLESILQGLEQLSFVQGQPLFHGILEVIQQSELSSEEKLDLAQYLLQGIQVFSQVEVEEGSIEAWTDGCIAKLSELKGKVDIDKLLALTKEALGVEPETPSGSVNLELNATEIAQFIWHNRATLGEGASRYVAGLFKDMPFIGLDVQGDTIESFDDLLKFLIEGDFIQRNLESTGGKITSELRGMIEFNLQKLVQEKREEMLSSFDIKGRGGETEVHGNEKQVTKLEGDLIGIFLTCMENKIQAILRDAMTSNEAVRVTKDQMIAMVLGELQGILQGKEDLVFAYLQELGVTIDTKDRPLVVAMVQRILQDPRVGELIGDMISSIGNRARKKDDVVGALNQIFTEAANSQGLSLIDGKVIDSATEIGSEAVFDTLLTGTKNLESFISMMEQALGVTIDVSIQGARHLLETMKTHISPELLTRLIKKYGKDIFSGHLPPEKLGTIGQEMYAGIEDKLGFITALMGSEVLDTTLDMAITNLDTSKYGIDPAKAKDVISVMRQHIDPGDVQRILAKYPSIFSGNLSPEMMQSIASDIYEGVDDKPKLLQDLLNLGIIHMLSSGKTEGNSEGVNLSEQDIALFVDAVYDTIETSDLRSLGQALDRLIGELGFGALKDIEIFGKSIGENLVLFFSSLDRKGLTQVLQESRQDIMMLTKGGQNPANQIAPVSRITMRIMEHIDIDNLQSGYREVGVSGKDMMLVEMMDEVQKTMLKHKDQITELSGKGYDLYRLYENHMTVEKWSDTEKAIQSYGEDMFVLLHEIISDLEPGFLEHHFAESSDSSGEKSAVLSTFISAFIGNNFWFVFGEGISAVFHGFDINAGRSMDNYFRDMGNKDDFGDTLAEFFVKLNKKEDSKGIDIQNPNWQG